MHPTRLPAPALRRLLGGLAAALLLLAACGDDGDSDESGDADGQDVAAAGADNGGDAGDDGGDASGEDGTRPALPDDPCGLLDEAEVEMLVGPAPTTEAEGGEFPGFGLFAQCVWERSDEGEGISAVAVSVIDGEDVFANYDAEIYSPEPVDGVGDRAIQLPSYIRASGGGTGTSIVAEQDGLVVLVGARGSVSLGLGDDQVTPNENPDLVPLATTVLDQLA